MNTCPPVQPCFCPQADSPVSGTLLPQGGPAAVIEIPIYGTQGFSVSITSNPTLPISLVPLISSATIQNGNILTLVTASPAINETLGPYIATIQVCNACGTLDLQVQVDVVADLNPVVTNCVLAQALWTPEGRVPTVGDTLLAFTPAGCRALLPPLTTCEAIQAMAVVAPQLTDEVVMDSGATCVKATVAALLALYPLCANLAAFPAGAPLAPADRLLAIQGGNCVTVTAAQVVDVVEANIDICALLQNLPNAVVQPTAVFYGQQGGACFEFAVSDLLALAVPDCPLLATCDGSCAAPAYSFASQPSSGMWMNGAILTLSTNNCADLIEIGASVNVTSTASDINITSGSATAGARMQLLATASGGFASLSGGNSTAVLPAGGVIISGGFDGFGFGGGNALIEGGGSAIGGGGSVLINAGSGPIAGGNVVVTGAGTPGSFLVQGFDTISLNDGANLARLLIDTSGGTVRIDTSATVRWLWNANGSVSINGTPGGAGQVLTSNGAGGTPTWQTPATGTTLNAVQNATGSAVRNHGTNTIRWEWNGGIAGPAFNIRGTNGGFNPFSTLVQIDDDGLGAYDSLLKVTAFGVDILNLATNPGTELRALKSKPTSVHGGDADGGSPSGILTLRGGHADVGLQPPGSVQISGGNVTAVGNANNGANVQITGGAVTVGPGNGGSVSLSGGSAFGGGSTGDVSLSVGSFTFHMVGSAGGELDLNGNPGVAGQAFTSNGAGAPPSWQTPTTSFPLLAPDGSCAAPSYSFAADGTSGVFRAGTGEIALSAAGCADAVTVGGGAVDIISTGGAGLVQVRGGDHVSIFANTATERFRVETGGLCRVLSGSSLIVETDNGYRASGQTSGAGASAGTLANAPSAGDPAFWLRVVINGTNHFIPAWI